MSSPNRLFGTDGIRGAFGTSPLDEATVRKVAVAIVTVLEENGAKNPDLLIGGDTRESTPTLTEWMGSTFAALGCRAQNLGVLPTPGVAHLVRSTGAAAGVIISASHNPYPDNGIKLIGADGFKFSDAWEERIEKLVASPPNRDASTEGTFGAAPDETAGAYRDHLVTSTPARLDALAVVLDAGHGAAFDLAGPVFEALGANVTVLHNAPDGRNVNQGCGSTAPELVALKVRDLKADLGFAFDGDADRVILVDSEGTVRDGDEILFLWAGALRRAGHLEPARIVATSMSNLGLERSLEPQEIHVERCDVGDREVVRTLREQGLILGGEQSGHIINLDLGTTGDGILTALQIAALVAQSGESLSQMLDGFSRFPQLLVNVQVSRKPPFEELPSVQEKARELESRLGQDGRLVLRYSGTESLARVMIEGPSKNEIESMASELALVIEQALA